MNTAETLSRIESDRFSALVNVASNVKTFLRAVSEQPEITELAAAMHRPDVSQEVCKRALAIASAEVDEAYEHPGDAALGAYLWLLSNMLPLVENVPHPRPLAPALLRKGGLPQPAAV